MSTAVAKESLARWIAPTTATAAIIGFRARCPLEALNQGEYTVFAGLVGEAKAAASGLMLKYVARASVAVPFAIVLGFALGLAEQTDTQEVISEATAQAFGQAPFALLGTLAAAPGGAPSLPPVVRLLARNLPLVIIDAMFWRTEPEAQQQTGEMEEVEDEENSAAGVRCGPARVSVVRLAGSEPRTGKVLAAPSVLRAPRQISRTVVEHEARPREGAPPMSPAEREDEAPRLAPAVGHQTVPPWQLW